MPTKIVFGCNSFDSINSLIGNRKAVLITSNGAVDRGLVDRLKSYTKNIVKVISNIKTHPDMSDLKSVYDSVHESNFDLVIAMGGGSVIDVAKFISVSGSHSPSFELVKNLTIGEVKEKNYKITPLISIPTTAGTGSEISPFSTIWDKINKEKYSLNLPELFSEVALYDPVLTLTVPKKITIQTGLDSLSHALESIWNKNANAITLNYSIKAAKLIMENLVDLVNNLDNLELRDRVMKASMYAGLAFSNTKTATAHALSYSITLKKGIDHGVACSFTLPLLVDKIIGRYDFIDNSLKEIFGELSSSTLRKFLNLLNISTKFEDYGISDEEFKVLKSTALKNIRSNNSLVRL